MTPAQDAKLLTAAWVAPMDKKPPFRDGGVVVASGKVIAGGDAEKLRRLFPAAQVVELGAAVILPGLVNPHVHLELSSCAAGDAPASFADWILSLPKRTGRAAGRPPEEWAAEAVWTGVEQCLRFGVTTVGDISQQMHVTRAILREGPIRCVSFGEVLGLAKMGWRYEELLPRAVDQSARSEWLRIGLSPHAPYTVDLPGYRECIRLADELDLPLATHLAETPHERAFLESHSGEFRQIWETLELWTDDVSTYPDGPIQFANDIGLLDRPALLAHVNYCDDGDLDLLAGRVASVVYCPRTHRYFGHPPHRWREMLARGVNVAVGTDSCASSPDLNLVNDLRLLHEIAPDFAVEKLWRMATADAARAIDADSGELSPGSPADLVVFDVAGDDPLREILESDRLPRDVWIAGERVTPRTPADGSRAV